jgi:hypothetical protein
MQTQTLAIGADLIFSPTIMVNVPGKYDVYASLYDMEGNYVDSTGLELTFSSNNLEVDIEFDSEAIIEHGGDGQYVMRIIVLNAVGDIVDQLKQIIHLRPTGFTGQILYQPSPNIPAIVTLYDSANNRIAFTETSPDGYYTLDAPAGTDYTLTAAKPGYLSYSVTNLALTAGKDIPAIDIRQMAGDVNEDGVVNAVDLTHLLSEFNKAPQNHVNADIDGNNTVNAMDLTYLLAGFNKRNVITEWQGGTT